MIPADAAQRAKLITGDCSCQESYTCRGLIAPDCAFHGYAEDIQQALIDTHNAAIEEEREACAKVAEQVRKRVTCPDVPRLIVRPNSQRIQRAIADAFEDGCDETAQAIRQRGECEDGR